MCQRRCENRKNLQRIKNDTRPFRCFHQKLSHLRVSRVATQATPGKFHRGRLHAGGFIFPCAIGAGTIKAHKREGDGATPAGKMRIVEGYFRADRIPRPFVPIRLRPLKKSYGWCDDPASGNYNRLIALPRSCRHEILWRDDDLYNLLIVLDYNLLPRIKYRGSAIFLHCSRPGLTPTEGCIALAQKDLLRLLPQLSARAELKAIP